MPGSAKPQRDRFDGANVRRDIFTIRPVAAGRPGHQHTVFVGQRDRRAVDLELDRVVWFQSSEREYQNTSCMIMRSSYSLNSILWIQII